RAPLVAARLAESNSPLAFSGAVISTFARDEIGRFVMWCRERNVTVVAAAPPFMYFVEYQANGFFEFDQAIRGFYESLGVGVLDAPGSNLFTRDEFFDTRYHLNSDAASMYSWGLARALAAVPRYEASFQDGIDLSRPGLPYFVQSVLGLSIREQWG